jgi:exosortase
MPFCKGNSKDIQKVDFCSYIAFSRSLLRVMSGRSPRDDTGEPVKFRHLAGATTPIYRRSVFPALAVAGSFVLLYWGTLGKLVADWWTDDNYSHGFFIVPLAAYFAFERRTRLAGAPIRPSLGGLIMILAALATLVAGILGAELFLTRVSIVLLVAGLVVFCWGWRHARILAFPIGFLLLMIPLPAIIFNQIAFPLQLVASRFGEWALQLANIPVLREGNVMTLANIKLEVAEACSGIRSLISLLTLGIVLGYFADGRGWTRIVIALTTIPVAIVANGVRVAGTGIAAHRYGAEAAEGFLHSFSGWIVFVVALGLLFLLQTTLLRVFPRRSGATT